MKNEQDTKSGDGNQQNKNKNERDEHLQETENSISNLNAHTQSTIITKANVVQ